jgi:post-segregation antitoxin (ccd killing protein)
MSHTETVTGKIPAKYKEILQKHGVNISALIRDAVEKEIEKIQEEEQRTALNNTSKLLQKIPDNEIVKIIRESRDKR